MLTIMLCPGGGAATPFAAAVKSIDLNTNHAKSPLAGVQWVLEAPKDFRVERMSGDVAPGGRVSGRIVGSRGKTSFDLDFDLALPAREAAAGLACRGQGPQTHDPQAHVACRRFRHSAPAH